MDQEQVYVGDRVEAEAEYERLRNLERVFDAHTFAVLGAVGAVARGARCLEVGAGAGSVVRWLAERVGPSGSVVALDANCRFLVDLPRNVEVVEEDVASLALGNEEFDLVHHRAVLAYVAEREHTESQLRKAVRPGGWLVAEEPIFPPPGAGWVLGDTDDGAVERALACLTELLGRIGTASSFGLRLPGLLEDLGLEDVGHTGATYVARGGSPHCEMIWPLLRALAPAFERMGLDDDVVDRAVHQLRDRRVSIVTPTLISAWGRRPG